MASSIFVPSFSPMSTVEHPLSSVVTVSEQLDGTGKASVACGGPFRDDSGKTRWSIFWYLIFPTRVFFCWLFFHIYIYIEYIYIYT